MDHTDYALRAAFSTLLLLAASLAAHGQDAALLERSERRLESARDELIEIRRDLHRHPEVSGREERTARIVANRLSALGLEVQTGIGGHGVVGILRGGIAGPVVAYRADMDAVYSDAPDPVPFASQTPGVRHICGHDIHTTVALGIAEALVEIRDDLPGTVKFIFQPAEENIRGAQAMIADGVLEDPSPAAIFAYHSAPLEVGQIGSVEGLALPGLDRVTVTVRGEGDLQRAARAYSRAVEAVSTGMEGVPPEQFTAAMMGPPQPGAQRREWTATGQLRAGSPAARARARQGIEEGLAALSFEGVFYDLRYEEQVLPDMVNDPVLVRSTLSTIRSVAGPDGLREINQVTPYFGEDFAFYQQHIPGAMYWLGVSNGELGYVGMPHSPDFVADEESIVIGARVMTAVLIGYLETH